MEYSKILLIIVVLLMLELSKVVCGSDYEDFDPIAAVLGSHSVLGSPSGRRGKKPTRIQKQRSAETIDKWNSFRTGTEVEGFDPIAAVLEPLGLQKFLQRYHERRRSAETRDKSDSSKSEDELLDPIALVLEATNRAKKLNRKKGKKHPVERARPDKWDLTYTVFPALESYHVGAHEIDSSAYPWIARVIHGPRKDYPHICTASCIDEHIFITSARCLLSLRVIYTRVVYNEHIFPVKAFVTPSTPTKQSFDDIGFVVVFGNTSYNKEWHTVNLYNVRRPTGEGFQWYDDYLTTHGHGDHVAVGWTVRKSEYKIKKPRTQFILSELEVVLGLDLCSHVYTVRNKIEGYYVPCYFGCEMSDFQNNSTKCERSTGAEGGAVYNTVTKKLFGIATWAAYHAKRELPIGFSVVNSNAFYKDKQCAMKIRHDARDNPPPNYLQSLCPEDD